MTVRIIKFGKNKFATNLFWQDLPSTNKPTQEIIRIGREHNSDMVCIPSVKNPSQAGFTTKTELSDCMTARSLAGALVESHKGSWLGLFKMPGSEEEYYYIGIQNHHILANSDIVGTLDETKGVFEEMLSHGGWNYAVVPEGINYPGTPVKHLTLAEMLTKHRAPKIKPLEFKFENIPTRKILWGLGITVALSLVYFAYASWQEALTKQEEAKRLQELEREKQLKAQILMTPWINAIPVDTLLTVCASQWHTTELSISGWEMKEWSCDGQKTTISYIKKPMASTVEFIQAAPNATLSNDGQQAAVTIPMPVTTKGSQPAARGLTAKAALMDYADSHILKVAFSSSRSTQPLPGNAPLTQQPWTLEQISLQSSYPGFDLLDLAKIPGFIMKQIAVTKESTEWKWRIEGELYANK